MGTVKEILVQFLVALLCIGSLAGLLMGIGMLLKPEQLARINKRLSHWVGTDKITEPLDRPRWMERVVYRHHRLVGGLLLAGSVFILYTFLFSYNARKITGALGAQYWGLLDAVLAFFIVLSAIAALIGIIVFIRPSALRELEKLSNRWVATDKAAKSLDRMIHSFDEHVHRRRQVWGVFLVAGSLYILYALGKFLWAGGLKFYQ